MRNTRILALAIAWAAGLSGAVDPELLAMVSPNVKVVAGIHLQHGLMTPFGQFLLSQVPQNPGMQQFANLTGFDLRKDLHEIVVAADSFATNGAPGGRNIVLLRGTFDIPKLTSLTTLGGGTAEIKNGFQWITPAAGPAGQAMAFLNSSILVGGAPDLIEAALARTSRSPALTEGIVHEALVTGAANDIWLVSSIPALEMLPPGQKTLPLAVFESITGYSGGLRMDDAGVTFSSEVLTRTGQDAETLAVILKFAAGMTKPPQSDVLNQAQVETDGSKLRLKLTVPESQMEQLVRSGSGTRRISFPAQ